MILVVRAMVAGDDNSDITIYAPSAGIGADSNTAIRASTNGKIIELLRELNQDPANSSIVRTIETNLCAARTEHSSERHTSRDGPTRRLSTVIISEEIGQSLFARAGSV